MIACFGEILLRMSPASNGEWLRNNELKVFVGGAELNVATALAKWNLPVQYITAMPDNYLSHDLLQLLQQKKIDTSKILLQGNRIGTYYMPQGADLKNAGVIYDRAHSSFGELQPGKNDWEKLLAGVDWLHVTAISPALNNNAAKVCEEALQFAASKNITTSIDLNYRSKLWQYGKQPAEVMPALVQHCDLVMGNIWSANQMLGSPLNKEELAKDQKQVYLEASAETATFIMKHFPKCKTVANTFRFDIEGGVKYYAALQTLEGQYVSKERETKTVVDKAGSGDCFMAGLIYGFENDLSKQDLIEFAAAAAFGKLHEKGDATDQSIEKVRSIIE
jgi:2-dehydro-3-deoxygluconokinase